MSIAAIVRALVAAKATPEMILAAVEAAESERDDALERRRQNDRDRKARQRTNEAVSRDVTGSHNERQPPSPRAPDPAHVEDNLQTKKISGQEENKQENAPKARERDLADFRTELSDLDAPRLEAIIKHRKAKRGQLTGHAAKLFRRDADECRMSIIEAVDACISRNWITVKPEYFAGRNRPNATAPPAEPRTVSELALHRLQTGRSRNEPSNHGNGCLDLGDGGGQAESSRGLQLIASAANAIGRIG